MAGNHHRQADIMPAEPVRAIPPAISIIIPTWNTRDLTMRCLDAVIGSTARYCEIIVVDNGSMDGTADAVNAWAETVMPPVKVIRNAANVGFSKAVNQAAAEASDPREALVILNSDCVVTEGWDRILCNALRDPERRIGAAGPMSNNVSGPQHDPMARYSTQAELNDYAAGCFSKHQNERHSVVRLVGFCLAIHPGAWAEIGELDEQFFPGNFDDDDWCRRAVNAGWELVICRDAFVHHEGRATFKANGIDYAAAMQVNEVRYVKKWRAELQREGLL